MEKIPVLYIIRHVKVYYKNFIQPSQHKFLSELVSNKEASTKNDIDVYLADSLSV